MKTKQALLFIILLLGGISCVTPYQLSTTIGADGSVHRDIYSGSYSPFYPDASWDVSQKDTLWVQYGRDTLPLTNKISGSFISLQEATSAITVDPAFEILFKPKETFYKQFRWFYTYYNYEAVFSDLKVKPAIPLSAYLTQEECRLWLEENPTYRGMNGAEVHQLLNSIEEKFALWINRNLLEICTEMIHPYATGTDLPDNDEFFRWIFKKYGRQQNIMDESEQFSTQTVCDLLDLYLGTDRFSVLYKNNKKEIDKKEEKAWEPLDLFYTILKFELQLPGKMQLATNSIYLFEKGKVGWNIAPYRFLADNFEEYRISARSRTPNRWAFQVTLLIIGLAIGTIVQIIWKSRQ